jgi:ABC-2 type transport system permease protein
MMSVVSDSFTILKRELMIFRSNIFQNVTRSIMFPFILLLIFGNLGNSVSNIPVAIVNYANNQQSLQFISSLQTQNELTIRAVTDQASAFSIFKSGGVDMVIVILPTFPDMHTNSPSVDIYYTNSQFTSLAVLPFIESKAESFGARVGSVSGGAAYSTSDPSAGGVAAVPSFAAAGNYTTFLLAGVIIMVAAFNAMFGGGMSIITDRISGTLKLFTIAPINRLSIIFGKIFAGSIQSMFTVTLTIMIGLLFGAEIAMGWGGVAWIFALAFLASIGMGAMASALAARIKRFEIYAIATQSIILPLWFVAGAFFPVSSLPSWLQPLSAVDPFTYAVQGMRYVMMSGYYPIGAIALDVSVLLVFAVVMLLFCIRMFKKTIE